MLPPMRPASVARLVGFGAILIAGSLLPGCRPWTTLGLRVNDTEVRSATQPTRVQPSFDTRVYQSDGPNDAAVVLTDFEPQRLAPDRSIGGVTGQILEVRMFVKPTPAKTPIERTACSCTIRYIIVSNGEVGVYAGAGFLLPDDDPGGGGFSGSISSGTLRLERATPGFVDLLGPSEIDVSFTARRDADTTRLLQAAARDFVSLATEQTTQQRAEVAGDPDQDAGDTDSE